MRRREDEAGEQVVENLDGRMGRWPVPLLVILLLIIIIFTIMTIIITRPKPPFGRQGLAGYWGKEMLHH